MKAPADNVDSDHEGHAESTKARQAKEKQSTELPVIELDNMIIDSNLVHYILTGKVARRQGRGEVANHTRSLDLDLISVESKRPVTTKVPS